MCTGTHKGILESVSKHTHMVAVAMYLGWLLVCARVYIGVSISEYIYRYTGVSYPVYIHTHLGVSNAGTVGCVYISIIVSVCICVRGCQ